MLSRSFYDIWYGVTYDPDSQYKCVTCGQKLTAEEIQKSKEGVVRHAKLRQCVTHLAAKKNQLESEIKALKNPTPTPKAKIHWPLTKRLWWSIK